MQQCTEHFSYIILHNPDDNPHRQILTCPHLTDEERCCYLAKAVGEEQIQDSDSVHVASEVLLSNTMRSLRDLDLFHFIRHLFIFFLKKRTKKQQLLEAYFKISRYIINISSFCFIMASFMTVSRLTWR